MKKSALTTHSIQTSSGRISYIEAGSGPVALFVHGVLLNKHLWRRQLTGLSDIRSPESRAGAELDPHQLRHPRQLAARGVQAVLENGCRRRSTRHVERHAV